MNLLDAFNEALQAVQTAETRCAEALAAAATYAANIAEAVPETVSTATLNAAATLADDAARALDRAADDLWQAVQDLPADTADAIKQAAADAFNAVSAAAKWAWQAAKHAAQAGIPGGAPIVPGPGLGGQSSGAGASGVWKPQVRRQDRRKAAADYDILQRQFFWRLLSSYPRNYDNFAVRSWRLSQQWAGAILPGLTITHPANACGYVLTESWAADIASAFARWDQLKTWLSTDPWFGDWKNILDGDGIPLADEPAYQEALQRYEYVQRETVIAEDVPLTNDDCEVMWTRDLTSTTTPADRLLERGAPPVTHYQWRDNPSWGVTYEGWYIWLPKVTRHYWFFPPIEIPIPPGIHWPWPIDFGGEGGGTFGVSAAKPQHLDDEVAYE